MKQLSILTKINPKFLFYILLVLITINIYSINVFAMQSSLTKLPLIYELFFVDLEFNFPSIFNALLILLNSGLLFLIYLKSSTFKKEWLFLSVIFFYLSFDEALRLHEKLVFMDLSHVSSFFYFSWLPVGIAFVTILFVFLFKFLKGLSKKYFSLFVLSGAIFVIGAIGLDSIGSHLYVSNNYEFSILYNYLASLEEFLEMSGMILFFYSLRLYIKENDLLITDE